MSKVQNIVLEVVFIVSNNFLSDFEEIVSKIWGYFRKFQTVVISGDLQKSVKFPEIETKIEPTDGVWRPGKKKVQFSLVPESSTYLEHNLRFMLFLFSFLFLDFSTVHEAPDDLVNFSKMNDLIFAFYSILFCTFSKEPLRLTASTSAVRESFLAVAAV